MYRYSACGTTAYDYDRARRMQYLCNPNLAQTAFKPSVDITENDNSIIFEFEIPGVAKENVKVSVDNENILSVKGEKKSDKKEADKPLTRNERKFGEFNRAFQLPENTDSEKITAQYEKGLLILTVPKKQIEKKEFEVTIN